MFMLGIRGQDGLSISVALVMSWLVTAISLLFVTAAFSWILIALGLCVTVYAAFLFHRRRKLLQFNTGFARELAFPTNTRAFRLVLGLNLAITLFCFVPSAAMLASKPAALENPETRWMMSTVFVFGWLGILGLGLQCLSRWTVNDAD